MTSRENDLLPQCADQIETSTSPSPTGKPPAFDYTLCPGCGEFDLCLGRVGKIEAGVEGFNRPFPSSPQSLFQSESKCEIFVMVINSTFNMIEN